MSNKMRAVLIGGAISGLLSVIPGIQACNCCCLWVILGGVVAAYILNKAEPGSAGGDGAIVGAGAGLIAGVMAATVMSLSFLVSGSDQFIDAFMKGFEGAANNPGMTPEGRQAIEEMSRAMREMFESTGPLIFIMASLITIPIYAGMGAVGGLIGMAVFNKPQPPAGYYPPGPGYPPYGQGYPPQYPPQYPPPPGQSPYSSAAQQYPGAYPPPPYPPPPNFYGAPPAPPAPPAAPANAPQWGPPPAAPGGQAGSSGSDGGSGAGGAGGNDIFGGSGSGGGDPFAPPGSGK